MATHGAYQFEVQPLAEQTSQQCAAAVWELVLGWVRERHQEAGLPSPPLGPGAVEFEPHGGGQGATLRHTQRQCGPCLLWTLDWRVPQANQPLVTWHFRVVLGCDGQSVGLFLSFGVELGATILRSFEYSGNYSAARGFVLALLVTLLQRWPCQVGGQPVPTHGLIVDADQMEEFVHKTLLDPNRVLPVFVLALDGPWMMTYEDLAGLQRWVLGLAQIVALPDSSAVSRLTELIGSERSCADAGMRSYWPGFTRDSASELHPFYSCADVMALMEEQPLGEHIYTLLAKTSAICLSEGPIIRRTRDALAAPPQLQFTPTGDGTFTLDESGQLVVLRAALEQTNRDRNQAYVQAQEAQRERDAVQARLAAVQSERNAARNKLDQAERDRAAANRARDAAQRSLQELQRLRDAAQAEQQRAAKRVASVETELKEVRLERERFRQEWDAAQQRARALEKELVDTQAQLAAAREALGDEKRQNEFYAELESALDEIERLRAEGDAARERIAELETDLRNTKDNLAKLWGPPAAAAPPPPAPPSTEEQRQFASVADALRAAGAEFADVLAVWEDAIQSAEASLFTSPAKVFQALRAMAEVGRAFFKAREGGPPLGPIGEAFRNRVPFKYTNFESQTTLGHFGAERVFHHREQSRQMQRHLTLGGGQTSNCLQIYFEFDEASRRVLIGHCGRHLPFARQRT